VSLAIEVLKEGDWLRALLAKKEGRAGALAEAFSAGKEQVYQQQTEQQEASCTGRTAHQQKDRTVPGQTGRFWD
jgi:hypothetical protein